MAEPSATSPLPALLTCLQQQPWRQLLAILAAHGLSASTRQSKTLAIAALHQHLTSPATLAAILPQLDAEGKTLLAALCQAGGRLPAHQVEQRFGAVRAYRPWQKAPATANTDAPPAGIDKPWLAPISATERLWYLGLLYRQPPKRAPGVVQHYLLPAELYPQLLHALLPPQPTRPLQPLLPPGRPRDLVIHLGVWLATLQAEAIRPLHQRWLPPTSLALLCQRLGLDQDDRFVPVRSERHHPYLAFLHYLAAAAGLVDVVTLADSSQRLDLTPQAWRWLAAPTPDRWRQLWQAWLGSPNPSRTGQDNDPDTIAEPYRFLWEPLSPSARADLVQQLRRLPQDRDLPLADVIQQWRLHDSWERLPAPRPYHWSQEDNLYDPLVKLCFGPLHWLGLIEIANDPTQSASYHLRLSRQGAWLLDLPGSAPPVYPPPAPATQPKSAPDSVRLPHHAQPLHLAQLAPYCQWQPLSAAPYYELQLDPARIAQAVANGVAIDAVLYQLGAACGRPLSRRQAQRIRAWAQQGNQVRLRPLLLLETATPELLADLRRRQLIRRRLGETIGPRQAVVNPLDVASLLQSLRTLGLYAAPPALAANAATDTTRPNDQTTPRPNDHATQRPHDSATTRLDPAALTANAAVDTLPPVWQWLLLSVYQQLGQVIDLPLTPPWDTRQRLLARLSPQQQAAAESLADTIHARLSDLLNGYLRPPPWALPDPPANLLEILEAAVATHQELEIRYWSVNTDDVGSITTRRILPQRLEERGGSSYLVAWCRLRNDQRVFRLDRIEAVRSVEEEGMTGGGDDRMKG